MTLYQLFYEDEDAPKGANKNSFGQHFFVQILAKLRSSVFLPINSELVYRPFFEHLKVLFKDDKTLLGLVDSVVERNVLPSGYLGRSVLAVYQEYKEEVVKVGKGKHKK